MSKRRTPTGRSAGFGAPAACTSTSLSIAILASRTISVIDVPNGASLRYTNLIQYYRMQMAAALDAELAAPDAKHV
jgi:hypothetical protein